MERKGKERKGRRREKEGKRRGKERKGKERKKEGFDDLLQLQLQKKSHPPGGPGKLRGAFPGRSFNAMCLSKHPDVCQRFTVMITMDVASATIMENELDIRAKMMNIFTHVVNHSHVKVKH